MQNWKYYLRVLWRPKKVFREPSDTGWCFTYPQNGSRGQAETVALVRSTVTPTVPTRIMSPTSPGPHCIPWLFSYNILKLIVAPFPWFKIGSQMQKKKCFLSFLVFHFLKNCSSVLYLQNTQILSEGSSTELKWVYSQVSTLQICDCFPRRKHYENTLQDTSKQTCLHSGMCSFFLVFGNVPTPCRFHRGGWEPVFFLMKQRDITFAGKCSKWRMHLIYSKMDTPSTMRGGGAGLLLV